VKGKPKFPFCFLFLPFDFPFLPFSPFLRGSLGLALREFNRLCAIAALANFSRGARGIFVQHPLPRFKGEALEEDRRAARPRQDFVSTIVLFGGASP
jgi:hypothetical protein